MKLNESAETMLLLQYLAQTNVGGRIYAEVPIGRHSNSNLWSDQCSTRRIDGVRLTVEPNESQIVSYPSCHAEFLLQIKHHTPELIEVKRSLNRGVIGQVLVAEDLFKAQYKVSKVKLVIVCKRGDSALEWACQLRNILVVKVA